MFIPRFKTFLLLATMSTFALPAQATTAQFLSRLYTEGLGRAPDTAAWKANPYFLTTPSNCATLNFSDLANNIYTSAEYNALGYTNKEKVLTLYRGILSREPDSGSIQYYANLLDTGVPITAIISDFVSSSEFVNLRNTKICSSIPVGQNTPYTWGQHPAMPLDSGTAPMTSAALQNLINAASNSSNKVVSLPQGTVVYANQRIVIPAGVTLTTAGNIVRGQYAKMARIVRSANFSDSTIVMQGSTNTQPGAVMDRIWVSGHRDHVVNGTTINYVQPAASVLITSGNNARVSNSRFDTPIGGTNIGIDGSEPTGITCNNISVSGNLLTGYTNTHYGNATTPYPYSDGITSKCAKTSIENNTIIDASDVSIILFYTAGLQTVQASKVTGNLIISTGIPAFAALMYEPYFYAGSTPIVRDFTGSSFSGNTFFAAEGTRFELGISAGRRPWNNLTSYISGGEFSNNSNAGISTTMQVGIGVGYAINTLVSGNALSYSSYTVSQTLDPYARCPSRAAVVTDNISGVTITGNTSHGVVAPTTPGNLACNF
jgi:hypothetical protein